MTSETLLPPDEKEPSAGYDEQARRERAEDALWTALGTLYRRRRVVLGVTIFAGVASVIISLLLANWYRGTVRVLIPEGSDSSLAAGLLGGLPAGAAALLGGGPAGDYTRYLAILTSRSMMEAAVDSFDLITVYKTEDKEHPLEEARAILEDNVSFEVDMEYYFLSISVLDKEPQRAADMANFLVRRLNEMSMGLSSEGAFGYRHSLEKRYEEARTAMDSVLYATQKFQEEHGVYDLTSQTESFFEQVGTLRRGALEAEIQYETLRSQYGENNAQVQTMREIALASDQKYRQALAGKEQILPVAQEEVPSVVNTYLELELETMIQRSILEVLAPLYEQARFQEDREMLAVQILDKAIPPTLKAKPKRSIICILATVSAFLLAVAYVLAYDWWGRNHGNFLRRLQARISA